LKTLDVAEGKVGERGLVTVPVAIQKALGLQKGDWIVWAVTNQHVEVRKK
jgi:bifunctional DNA-binding transcriptional regulator/antitoxin component of YhaV-PrlF toxin-antitoxin module